MLPPRYRTLDGDEIELPVAMGRWVLVPRRLARFDPELAWTLDYEDAPEPEDADPRLDFDLGALLVSIERWNDHAELEPNLAPCSMPEDATRTIRAAEPELLAPAIFTPQLGRAARLASVASRTALAGIAALALAYVAGVCVWLWSLRAGINGPRLSTGLVLVGAAVLLAWLAGVAWGAACRGRARSSASARRATPSIVVSRLAHHPLETLRLGLAIQLAGFAVLVVTHGTGMSSAMRAG